MSEAGGINLYGFVFNRPVDWFDPLGLAIVYVPLGTYGPPAPADVWVYYPQFQQDDGIHDESMDFFNALTLFSGAKAVCSGASAIASRIAMREALAAEQTTLDAWTAARAAAKDAGATRKAAENELAGTGRSGGPSSAKYSSPEYKAAEKRWRDAQNNEAQKKAAVDKTWADYQKARAAATAACNK